MHRAYRSCQAGNPQCAICSLQSAVCNLQSVLPRVYHSSFSPNCSCRGALACPLMTPNEDDVTLVLGPENWTRLNAFSASMRNCAMTPGFTSKFLNSERSKLRTPCARNTG